MTTFFRKQVAQAALQQRRTQFTMRALEQKTLMGEFVKLKTLRSVVQEHGITRGLLAFANHDTSLSQAVSNIPSTESLNSVPLSVRDKRHIASIEGMDEVIAKAPSVTAEWVRKLAEDLDQIIQSTTNRVVDLQISVAEATENLHNHTILEVALDTTLITARTVQGFDAIFSALNRRIQQIGGIDVASLLTSNEYRSANSEYIDDLITELKPMLGYTLINDQFISSAGDNVDDNYCQQEASLTDLGYNTDTVSAMLESISTLLQTMIEFDNKRNDIVSSLTEAAEQLAASNDASDVVLNDVPQLISNYTSIIVELTGDALRHIQEASAVVEEILENAADRDGDGRSN